MYLEVENYINLKNMNGARPLELKLKNVSFSLEVKSSISN